jgi:hypothetical protein
MLPAAAGRPAHQSSTYCFISTRVVREIQVCGYGFGRAAQLDDSGIVIQCTPGLEVGFLGSDLPFCEAWDGGKACFPLSRKTVFGSAATFASWTRGAAYMAVRECFAFAFPKCRGVRLGEELMQGNSIDNRMIYMCKRVLCSEPRNENAAVCVCFAEDLWIVNNVCRNESSVAWTRGRAHIQAFRRDGVRDCI